MRKNRTMRAAFFLLVFTLITSCFVGGNFARFSTNSSGGSNARAVYWGFGQSASTSIDMFSGTYQNVSAVPETVSGFENVIAPGNSKAASFAFGYAKNKTTGTAAPEVAYTLSVDASVTGDYDSLDSNPNFKWTLQKPGKSSADEYNTADALVAAIKALSGESDGSKDYPAGKLPDNFSSPDELYKVGWTWKFITPDDSNEENGSEMRAQDAVDTAMGTSPDLENVTFTITISAVQID